MKNSLFGILALIVIMLTTACTDTTNFIYGDVVDRHSGEAIEGCQVMLMASNGTLLSVQKTGADGRWGFEVEIGEYSVAFAMSGYADVQEDYICVEFENTQVKLITRLGQGSSETEITWTENGSTSSPDGDGTEKAPFIIKTSKHLDFIREENSGLYFKLANDIDLHNKNWLPIENFSGTLDGNGKTIYNLRVENDDISYRGLIGELSGTVKNLTVSGVKIKGSNTGAIAGKVYRGTVDNCKVILADGSMLQGTCVGGIAGQVGGTSYIENCTVESTNYSVAINGSKVGGIAGYIDYSGNVGNIKNCRVNCNIAGESHIGGICGYIYSYLPISSCEYKGNISGTQNVGGIGGYDSYGCKIIACKAVANIDGDDYLGGLLGSGRSTIIASYSNGEITAASSAGYIGGISGYNNSYYSSTSYLCYSTTICDHSKFVPINNSNSCYSVYSNTDNIAEKMEEAYSDYADYWNFNNVWIWEGTINREEKQVICPRLAWEK